MALRPPPGRRAPGSVHVIAPSGPVTTERLERSLPHVRARFGVPTLAANLGMRGGYFAGDDSVRLRALDFALRDEQASVVWAARGGYGLTRLLDRLDPGPLRERPKLLIGFSDLTALCCWAWTSIGSTSIHGPVVAQLDELGPDDLERVWSLIDGEVPLPLIAHDGATILTGGRVEGTLIAGNLELLRTLIGTPFMPSLDGAILAIEEVGERPYRIDRALTQLIASGSLRGIRGVAVGDLEACNEPESGGSRGWSAREVVEERLARLGVPVVIGFGFGHADGRNAALGFGVAARLDADAGALEMLEPVTCS